MAKFEDVVEEVKRGIVEIVTREGRQYLDAAVQDAEAFLKGSREDIERWLKQLAAGQLVKNEFASLVRGKKDLAEMVALKQAGLATASIDRIRTALIDLVITAVGKLV